MLSKSDEEVALTRANNLSQLSAAVQSFREFKGLSSHWMGTSRYLTTTIR